MSDLQTTTPQDTRTMTMTIRAALEELGVERVQMAMAAFEDERNRLGSLQRRPGYCHCFVGRATGLPEDDIDRAFRSPGLASAIMTRLMPGVSQAAVELLDDAFDGDQLAMDGRWDEIRIAGTRAELYAECVRMFAEHGSHPEPAVFACGGGVGLGDGQ